MAAHSGQSMLVLPTSETVPSSAVTKAFIAPEPVHTSSTFCGLTMGDATATPSDNTMHASTKRAISVKLRRICMVQIIHEPAARFLTPVRMSAILGNVPP